MVFTQEEEEKLKKIVEVEIAKAAFYKANNEYQIAFNAAVAQARATLDPQFLPNIKTLKEVFDSKNAELQTIMEIK